MKAFIISSWNQNLDTLRTVLKEQKISIIMPDFESGKSIFQTIEDAIKESDLVIAVIDDSNKPNDFFEMGIARGFRKPMVFIVAPGVEVPTILAGLHHFRASLKDLAALEFNFKILLQNILKKKPQDLVNRRIKHRKIFNVDAVKNAAYAAKTESAVITVLRELLEKFEGVNVVTELRRTKYEADLVVWLDSIQNSIPGPILIEYKHGLRSPTENRNFLNKYRQMLLENNIQLGILLTRDFEGSSLNLTSSVPTIFHTSLVDFIDITASGKLAQKLISIRNKAIHG